VRTAVLDGEIVCVDRDGRPHFYELLYRRRRPVLGRNLGAAGALRIVRTKHEMSRKTFVRLT
jgi:hypothetical protein